MDTNQRFDSLKCCVVIPTYNNENTLRQVIEDVLEYTKNVIVVNDGSTDSTPEILSDFNDQITVHIHSKNQGKGKALRNAFKLAAEQGYEYAITIDSDGQHFASDLPSFLEEVEEDSDALVIGARNMTQENVPGKSSFGNKFSNFWFWVETGIKLDDTQSGYRLYPIHAMKGMRYITTRFEFEVEVIVKAAWRRLGVKNIPIKVHYEPGKKRISHFRPFTDFSRISVLNTWLVTLALLYYIPLRFFRSLTKENIKWFLREHLLNKEEPASRKAFSIGFGVFMGIFPIWGYQMLVGVALAHLMKLNKVLFLVAANISLPPLIPFIIYISYKVGAHLVTDPKDDLLFSSGLTFELVKDNLIQYLLGAILLAVVSGVIATIISYAVAIIGRPRRVN